MPVDRIGETYIYESKPIDSLAVSQGAIDCIDIYKLLSNHNAVESDYRIWLIDIALEDYFEDKLCK